MLTESQGNTILNSLELVLGSPHLLTSDIYMEAYDTVYNYCSLKSESYYIEGEAVYDIIKQKIGQFASSIEFPICIEGLAKQFGQLRLSNSLINALFSYVERYYVQSQIESDDEFARLTEIFYREVYYSYVAENENVLLKLVFMEIERLRGVRGEDYENIKVVIGFYLDLLVMNDLENDIGKFHAKYARNMMKNMNVSGKIGEVLRNVYQEMYFVWNVIGERSLCREIASLLISREEEIVEYGLRSGAYSVCCKEGNSNIDSQNGINSGYCEEKSNFVNWEYKCEHRSSECGKDINSNRCNNCKICGSNNVEVGGKISNSQCIDTQKSGEARSNSNNRRSNYIGVGTNESQEPQLENRHVLKIISMMDEGTRMRFKRKYEDKTRQRLKDERGLWGVFGAFWWMEWQIRKNKMDGYVEELERITRNDFIDRYTVAQEEISESLVLWIDTAIRGVKCMTEQSVETGEENRFEKLKKCYLLIESLNIELGKTGNWMATCGGCSGGSDKSRVNENSKKENCTEDSSITAVNCRCLNKHSLESCRNRHDSCQDFQGVMIHDVVNYAALIFNDYFYEKYMQACQIRLLSGLPVDVEDVVYRIMAENIGKGALPKLRNVLSTYMHYNTQRYQQSPDNLFSVSLRKHTAGFWGFECNDECVVLPYEFARYFRNIVRAEELKYREQIYMCMALSSNLFELNKTTYKINSDLFFILLNCWHVENDGIINMDELIAMCRGEIGRDHCTEIVADAEAVPITKTSVYFEELKDSKIGLKINNQVEKKFSDNFEELKDSKIEVKINNQVETESDIKAEFKAKITIEPDSLMPNIFIFSQVAFEKKFKKLVEFGFIEKVDQNTFKVVDLQNTEPYIDLFELPDLFTTTKSHFPTYVDNNSVIEASICRIMKREKEMSINTMFEIMKKAFSDKSENDVLERINSLTSKGFIENENNLLKYIP